MNLIVIICTDGTGSTLHRVIQDNNAIFIYSRQEVTQHDNLTDEQFIFLREILPVRNKSIKYY